MNYHDSLFSLLINSTLKENYAKLLQSDKNGCKRLENYWLSFGPELFQYQLQQYRYDSAMHSNAIFANFPSVHFATKQ